MKIAFLSHFDWNLYLFRLPVMIKMVQEGHEVFAIIPRGESFDKFAQYGIKTVEYKIDRKSLNPLKELMVIYEIYKTIKDLNLDILHAFTAKPNIYGTIAGFFAKTKTIICSVTGLGSFYIDDSKKSLFVRFLIESLYRVVFLRADGVIFQNSDDIAYFRDKKIVSTDRSFLVKSSGIDTDKFSLDNLDLKKIQDLKQELNPFNKKVVLMIARAIIHKGVLEYFSSAEILKDKNYLFLYVGGIDEGNPSSLTKEYLENSENVFYLGERWDVVDLIAMCDLFVLPSYREGVPRTLLEAASMSKAIVTTDAPGCKEVVINGKNGYLVPVANKEILAQKIDELLQDKEKLIAFGNEGRIIAQNEFSTKIVVKKYLEIYKKLVLDVGK